jgi:hypothetical protein
MTLLRPTLSSLFAVLLLVPAVPAQRIVPPAPAEYAVRFRYRIRVGGNERVVQYREMLRHLAAAGFRRTDTPEPNEAVDADADRMSGLIAPNRVGDLLGEPHVKSILLMPAGYKLPDNPEQRVLVQIKLVETSSLNQQRALFYQALDKLRRMGLIDKVGYDQEDYSRILGTIPAGDVDDLLIDLRLQPLGWLSPQSPVESLPEPIRTIDPIRGVEVLPDPEGVPPSSDTALPNVPALVDGAVNVQAKIAPDLRAAAAAAIAGPVRFEVVLTHTPALDDAAWHAIVVKAANVAIEGHIGPVVTVLGPANAIAALAALPEVATVRPPRMATIQPASSSANGPAAIADSGLDRLHKLGFKGAGVRVAIIDADFTGVGQHVGRELSKDTAVIDLTAARNPLIVPEPLTPGAEPGRGTRLALAVRVAAPDAEVVLVRVDPAAMYQLFNVARYIHGDPFRPESLVARNRELLAENNALRVDRGKLTADRQAAQSNFSEDEAAVQQRRDIEARSATLTRREQEFNDRLKRFYDIEAGLVDLRRVNIVVCPLAWDEGYAFDGSGPLARYLDDVFYGRPRRKPVGPLTVAQPTALWFQAAGNTRGQVWNGPLIDNDGNGAFEFAPPDTRPPQGLWTTEINFLHWQPAGGQRSFDLPAGAKVRLTFQWTEAHDPNVSNIPGPDLYRVPLADLRVLVLRQRDPSGTRVSNDDFNVITQTEQLPQLIERQRSWATYEHVVEFAVDTPGRFAVRLEGTIPPTIRPPTVASLPIQDRSWSPHGRLFVGVTGASGGQLVIGDYQPGLGGLGSPGNGVYPRTTGATDAQGREQPYSANGPPSGQQLLAKPRWLAFDELPGVQGGGTEQATAFAAGLYASVMSAGTIESQKLNWLQVSRGGVLRVPPVWLDQLERRMPKTGRE